LQDGDGDRIDNMFDADFTKGQDNNGDGIDDKVILTDANKNGVADFLDNNVRVARTTLLNPVAKLIIKPNATKLTKQNTSAVALKVVATPTPKLKTITKETTVAKVVAKPSKVPKPQKTKTTQVTKAVQVTGDDDGDGLSNSIEIALGMNPKSGDSDDDGVPDFIEIGSNNKKPQDSDQDGKPDVLDTDDDNDGILTKLEDVDKNGQVANDDTDKDGVPNYLDANDDGDSRLTRLEGANKDTDKDGIPDYLDNSDGVSNPKVAKVVVLYDEKNKPNQSLKDKHVQFNLATKKQSVKNN